MYSAWSCAGILPRERSERGEVAELARSEGVVSTKGALRQARTKNTSQKARPKMPCGQAAVILRHYSILAWTMALSACPASTRLQPISVVVAESPNR